MAETSIDDPTAITVTFLVSDGAGGLVPATGYEYVLEREGVKIQGTLQNPHLDTGLEPATSYSYTGKSSMIQFIPKKFVQNSLC